MRFSYAYAIIYLIFIKKAVTLMQKAKSAVISLLIAICLLFSSCSATINVTDIYTAENADNKYHTASSDTEKIASSDYLQLYIDKKTCSVNVKDNTNSYVWRSLPDKSNSTASAFALTLYTSDGVYNLNTQDNSVAYSSATYETAENGVKVNYVLSDNEETAKKNYEDITKKDIYVAFSVTYTLSEQSLTTTIDLSDLKCTKGAFVSQINVLPYFGASYDDSIQDYFLVPDGSGAVMHTATANVATDNVSIAVYGADPYMGSNENTASATVPVFGIKRNNNAFAAIITDGDALATINASRKISAEPSKASATFTVTPVKTSEKGTAICGNTYKDKITVVYKFLADSSADYSGMAYVAREEFISNGILPYETYNENDDSIPFCITVIGSQNKTTLTTIQQAIDIIDALKSKGIDNIQLNFKGLLSGGYSQKNLYSAKVLNELGSESAYRQLYEYAKRQNYTFYTDINIFSSSKKQSSFDTVDGQNAIYLLKNDLAYRNYSESRLSSRIGSNVSSIGASKRNKSLYSQTDSYIMYLTPVKNIAQKLSAFIADDIASVCSDFSVSDAGYILSSDRNTDRQASKNIVASAFRTLSGNNYLSVKKGNIYTLYGADFVSETEFDTFYQESNAYEPVPFIQSIIHGSAIYNGKAIDAADPLYKYDMLQYIEYGAMPSFEWVYDASSIFCYDGYLLSERISEFTEFYAKANDALKDLSDAAIISHKKIQQDTDGKNISGVYCTTYSNGTRIYVNYTGSTVITPENIVVGAYDFIKAEK